MGTEDPQAKGRKLVTGRTDVERELDSAVPSDRDVDLSEGPPRYAEDMVIDGVSTNALADRHAKRAKKSSAK